MSNRILLVEGPDDYHVIGHLLTVREGVLRFSLEKPGTEADYLNAGGVETLVNSLPVRLQTADLECLALVVDADRSASGRWQSIRDRMRRDGVEGVPEAHAVEGTVAEILVPPEPKKRLRFGVWIMPDNCSPGVIEDFVAGMIHSGDEMLPCVEEFLNSVRTKGQRFSDAHRPKARIHSWLAVSELPGRPMGQAIKADGHLDAEHPSVEPFLDWIHRALVA